MSDRIPTLAELMRRSAAALVDGQYVTLPARVERYDADRQCVDAQPTIMREVVGEDGAVTTERLPVVTNAPVVFPGSGPYRITWPVELGSMVVLHFTSASMDRWLAIGGGGVEPRDGRRHDLSSAFAVPGGHSFGGATAPSTTAPTDALVVHGEAIKLGGPGATELVAWHSALTALADAFSAWIPVTNDGGAALKSKLESIMGDGWPAGSSKVKAE